MAITASGLVLTGRHVARHDALADHHDPVGDLEGLLHDVRDDDDADALLRHLADHVEAAPRLLHAECGERLVEQHELAAPMDEAVELDRLALAAGQMLDLGAQRRDARAGIGERLSDHALHGLLVEHGNAEHLARDLAPHEEIRDDIDIGAEREVLVDRLDPRRLGFRGSFGQELPAFEEHAAGGRLEPAGDDLDQRGFSGAVVAEQGDDLAPADREADALQRFDGAVFLADVVQHQQRLAHRAILRQPRLSGATRACGCGPCRAPSHPAAPCAWRRSSSRWRRSARRDRHCPERPATRRAGI